MPPTPDPPVTPMLAERLSDLELSQLDTLLTLLATRHRVNPVFMKMVDEIKTYRAQLTAGPCADGQHTGSGAFTTCTKCGTSVQCRNIPPGERDCKRNNLQCDYPACLVAALTPEPVDGDDEPQVAWPERRGTPIKAKMGERRTAPHFYATDDETPEPVMPPPSTPPDDATLIRAALAGDYADTGTTLPGVSPADRWLDHHTRTIGPPQHAWAARAQANRCEAMRRVLAGDPREPRVIAGEIVGRADWVTGSGER